MCKQVHMANKKWLFNVWQDRQLMKQEKHKDYFFKGIKNNDLTPRTMMV